MDKYTVFGLLLMCPLGPAHGVSIRFTSPVMKGDDVTITCAWLTPGTFSRAKWYRRTEANVETNIYSTGRSPEPGFEYVSHHYGMRENSYTIKLVKAKKEDEGTYWCNVTYLIGFSSITSKSYKKRLDVTVPDTTTSSERTPAITPTTSEETTTTTTTTTTESTKITTYTPTAKSSDISVTTVGTNVTNGETSEAGGLALDTDPQTVQGPSVGVVAGSVVGGVLLLLAVIVTVSVCICRRRRRKQEDTEMVESDVYGGYVDDSSPADNAFSNTSAQVDEAKMTAVKETSQEVPVGVDKLTTTTASNGNPDVKHGLVDKIKDKAAAKETPEVQYAKVDKTKKTAAIDDNNVTEYAQVDKSKKKTGAKEKPINVDESQKPAARGNPDVEYAQVDKSKKKKAAKKKPPIGDKPQKPATPKHHEVEYAQVDKSKMKKAAAKVETNNGDAARDGNPDVQYAQVDKSRKERALPEGSHYAQVALTGDGKKERVIVRTVPDTEYSAVKLRAPVDQDVDTDSD